MVMICSVNEMNCKYYCVLHINDQVHIIKLVVPYQIVMQRTIKIMIIIIILTHQPLTRLQLGQSNETLNRIKHIFRLLKVVLTKTSQIIKLALQTKTKIIMSMTYMNCFMRNYVVCKVSLSIPSRFQLHMRQQKRSIKYRTTAEMNQWISFLQRLRRLALAGSVSLVRLRHCQVMA